MAGFGTAGIVDKGTAYLFVTNLVLLVILIAGSTELPKRAVERIFGKQKLTGNAETCVPADGRGGMLQAFFVFAVFLLSTAYLVNATYNPFLYFRF